VAKMRHHILGASISGMNDYLLIHCMCTMFERYVVEVTEFTSFAGDDLCVLGRARWSPA
jgi:hypothetical protein